ncbi:MAG: hypothetical protein JSV52_01710 [Candidatus Zixiibacteriota bacterium]|nr:MAG: hypothetical protein JSV52_01710 [candidate division Zixibacteria bacterium]
MISRFASIATLAVFCLVACCWLGCSDNSIETVISEDDFNLPTETGYFLPVAEGFSTVYLVSHAAGGNQTITLTIGRQVQNGAVTAYEWFSDDGAFYDTGYVVMTTDAAFFYDGVDADPEKILGFPLIAGNSWERFSDTYDDEGFTDIITGIVDDDDSSIFDDTSAKTIPTTGGNTMTVIGEEQLELSNGLYLSNTIKIYNEGSTPGKKNYYWYAAGVGLVKYIIGTTDGSYPRGDVVGELIDFGR